MPLQVLETILFHLHMDGDIFQNSELQLPLHLVVEFAENLTHRRMNSGYSDTQQVSLIGVSN